MTVLDKNKLDRMDKLRQEFINSGLRAYTGYFPNNFYGKEAERYYKWSQRAFEILNDCLEDRDSK